MLHPRSVEKCFWNRFFHQCTEDGRTWSDGATFTIRSQTGKGPQRRSGGGVAKPFAPAPHGTALSDVARWNHWKFFRRLSQFPPSFLGACPTLTFLLRRTIRNHLRRSRPEKILNVFQRIHLRFSRACGLASGRTSFASSRRQCRTGSWPVSMGAPFLRRIALQAMPRPRRTFAENRKAERGQAAY